MPPIPDPDPSPTPPGPTPDPDPPPDPSPDPPPPGIPLPPFDSAGIEDPRHLPGETPDPLALGPVVPLD